MGKWAWRAIVGEETLWLEIVRGGLGLENGDGSGFEVIQPKQKARGWWGQVLYSIWDCRGCWFTESVSRRVGNGEKTSFWDDHWVGEDKLRATFPRLYEVSLGKECSVASAGRWEANEWVWGQGWRRDLRDWELESLKNLTILLNCRKTTTNVHDRWAWKHEKNELYSVKSSYRFILERKLEPNEGNNKSFKMLWKNWATPKAQATAWRIISRRVATKRELCKRGVISVQNGLRCPLCNDAEESINHLFVECNRVWAVWCGCLDWTGLQAPMPKDVQEFFVQFCSLVKGKRKRIFLASVWVCTVWLIWMKRNDVVFSNGEWCSDKLLGEMKSIVWSWTKCNRAAAESNKSFSSWSVNPL